MPAVVPQLKSITLGGAVAGVGIEASSFRHGLVHDTVAALDVLTARRAHRPLHARQRAPRSLLRLSQLVRDARLRARASRRELVPVKRYVQLEHVRHADAAACFADVARHCAEGRLDFLDGTVFAPDEMYLTLGRFVDDAPWTSDYTFERIYYRSIRERGSDYLTDARLPVALGHRLVLVLEERRRAASAGAPAARPQAAQFDHLPADHALEQPRRGVTPRARPAARPARRSR